MFHTGAWVMMMLCILVSDSLIHSVLHTVNQYYCISKAADVANISILSSNMHPHATHIILQAAVYGPKI